VKPDLRGVVEEAKRLESLAMAIYTKFASIFRSDPELHGFWMSMARHEAAHVGALALLSVLLEQSGVEVELNEAPDVIANAASDIEALHSEATAGVSSDRAFAVAVELESLELEDLVLDLIHVLSDPAARDHAEQMLLHDLSDLSLMIEKHCCDETVLARVDEMVEGRVGGSAVKPIVVRRV
jgi:hypothetical protein